MVNDRRTFLVMKQLNDIYFDVGNYAGSILPAVEHWLGNDFGVRIGVEGSLSVLEGETGVGAGAIGGVTIRFGRDLWAFDLNGSYRRRPSRMFPGQIVTEWLGSASLTRNRVFVSRRVD